MSAWIDPDQIARAMGDGTAGYAANDNREIEADTQSWLGTFATMLIGSVIVALTLYAWIA